MQHFAEAIRGKEPINASIAEGHKSTPLPQLGNIAYRVGCVLKCDPANGHILNDKEAMNLWGREYEKGWQPKICNYCFCISLTLPCRCISNKSLLL